MDSRIDQITQLVDNNKVIEHALNVLHCARVDYRAEVTFTAYPSISSGTNPISFSMKPSSELLNIVEAYWKSNKSVNDDKINDLLR